MSRKPSERTETISISIPLEAMVGKYIGAGFEFQFAREYAQLRGLVYQERRYRGRFAWPGDLADLLDDEPSAWNGGSSGGDFLVFQIEQVGCLACDCGEFVADREQKLGESRIVRIPLHYRSAQRHQT